MKIPGPQIMGWFLQLVRKDESIPYEKVDSELFKINKIMNDVTKSTEKIEQLK